jgi:hypothetical protein
MPAVVMPAVIVRSLMCYLYCAIFITLLLYVVGSIAFNRRGRYYARYCCHNNIIVVQTGK